jgi:hypothetical protein
MKYDIFVSYRRSDREVVAAIVRRLEQRGVGVWYDADIEGGADWRDKIVEALTNSDMLAIFFSEECNNSRQLKKELAVADNLGKPVVPILIEDTQPRGAYLYELADRNWIQAFPNPMEKLDELVEHLAGLAGKSEGGLDGRHGGAGGTVSMAAPPPAPAPAPAPTVSSEADAAVAPVTAPAAEQTPEPQVAAEAPVEKPLDDLFAARTAPTGAAHAPSKKTAPLSTAAYIGKKSEQGKTIPTRDILPFKWVDLIFLVPALGAFSWFMKSERVFQKDGAPMFEILGIAIIVLAAIGLYGALVFPVRYYMRRRPLWTALGKYLLSSLVLYLALLGAFFAGYVRGVFPDDDPKEVAVVFGGVWLGFTVIAFIIYGVLSAQRAMRSFKSNIKKI